jgi:hypothetical protein
MEIFRHPVTTGNQLQDVLYVTSNRVLSEDVSFAYVFIAFGATLTLSDGYTLTASQLVAEGDFISLGTSVICRTSAAEQFVLTGRSEPFRSPQNSDTMNTPPTTTTKKEVFRGGQQNSDVLGSYS